jgi:hypothetical protein
MRTEQIQWTRSEGWTRPGDVPLGADAQLVLVFGATECLRDGRVVADLRANYPAAQLLGCSTSGEIAGTHVQDDTVVATAVAFDRTTIHTAQAAIQGETDSRGAGERLAAALPADGLSHVFVLSDGLKVNGSQLVEGLASRLPVDTAITGGLAGDGARFGETLVVVGGRPVSSHAVAVGFYGPDVRVGYASLGGWDPFGPERIITRARGNVLYELDGHSALGLYKRYLGDHARELPSSGLLFPLCVRTSETDEPIVRTILAVDEATQSMTFAGDLPEGGLARLMKANFDRLIDGATGAAKASYITVGTESPDLALLISCVGRKLVLKQRIEEEVEAVRDVLGPATRLAGFYSYGEISPFTPSARCQLHNQTMTITTISERPAA